MGVELRFWIARERVSSTVAERLRVLVVAEALLEISVRVGERVRLKKPTVARVTAVVVHKPKLVHLADFKKSGK